MRRRPRGKLCPRAGACGGSRPETRTGGRRGAPQGRGWDRGPGLVPSAFFSTRSKFLINNFINVTACHRPLSLRHQGQRRGHTFSSASSRPEQPYFRGLVPMETAPRRTHAQGNASLCVCAALATRAATRGPRDSLRPLPFLAVATSQPPSSLGQLSQRVAAHAPMSQADTHTHARARGLGLVTPRGSVKTLSALGLSCPHPMRAAALVLRSPPQHLHSQPAPGPPGPRHSRQALTAVQCACAFVCPSAPVFTYGVPTSLHWNSGPDT